MTSRWVHTSTAIQRHTQPPTHTHTHTHTHRGIEWAGSVRDGMKSVIWTSADNPLLKTEAVIRCDESILQGTVTFRKWLSILLNRSATALCPQLLLLHRGLEKRQKTGTNERQAPASIWANCLLTIWWLCCSEVSKGSLCQSGERLGLVTYGKASINMWY